MATVATVYSIEGQARNAEAIMGLKEADDTHKPRARNKRVWASVEREPQAVTNEVFQEALRRDRVISRSLRALDCVSLYPPIPSSVVEHISLPDETSPT